MDKFQMGQTFEHEYEVTKNDSVNRMGKDGADVLSTPALLGLMENACILQSEPYLPEQHTTVGYAVDGLRHVAPTAMGEKVQVKVRLTEVDRNRLTYDIEVYEGPDKRIAVANHKRAVIAIQ
ncbi:MAG: thioesterase family protein [Chloroflexi bacterium]|nr:thioesterase family protein [Chloroflexota bacterium]MCH8869650.1 thioesterase family protein [Chloroflexota bacterium]MCI0771638.1 thioesterase family protein [Chloroflexota bacterium]MCI0791369.1 thioesterase family protein [Chloroflexota bacterium]MCI0840378.1 thioesterase family protein [Chloroflexota bacterium]